MDKMSLKKIQKCLEVAELYGKQQADINVSLTVISLLWNVGDMLGTRSAEEGRPRGCRSCQRQSTEVRNSGARTLFAVATAHGNRLSVHLWKEVLWENLFPLLRYAFHMSVTSSKEEAEAALLGKSKGEQVRLVVHHSRNTEQKQWDETVVVCLAGMTRLIRSHLGIMSQLEGFEEGWSELMVVVESSLAGGRKEVALAAMNLISGTNGNDTCGHQQSHVAKRYPGFGCWGRGSYKFWLSGSSRNPWSEDDAGNPVQPVGMPPVQKTALNVLLKLQPTHDETLWPDYLETVAKLLDPEHAIALMDSQAATSGVKHSGAVEHDKATSEPLPPPSSAQYRFALNAAFVERVMEQLTILFEQAPLHARAAAFPGVVDVLGRCMELKFTAYEQTLWRTAANVFLRLVPVELLRAWFSLSNALSKFLLGSHNPAPEFETDSRIPTTPGPFLDPSKESGEDADSIPVIPYVSSTKSKRKGRLFSLRAHQDPASPHDAQEHNVLPPESNGSAEKTANEARDKEDYDLDLKMLDCLTDDILTACGTASQPAIDGLIQIIEQGIKPPKDKQMQGLSNQANFGLICIRKMSLLSIDPRIISKISFAHAWFPALMFSSAARAWQTSCIFISNARLLHALPGVLQAQYLI
eukprot:jgi/Picre1/28247/NNA_003653.t1